jgi:hypothetical protein
MTNVLLSRMRMHSSITDAYLFCTGLVLAIYSIAAPVLKKDSPWDESRRSFSPDTDSDDEVEDTV